MVHMRHYAIVTAVICFVLLSVAIAICSSDSDASDPTVKDGDVTYTLHESGGGNYAEVTWTPKNNQSITIKSEISYEDQNYPVTNITIPKNADKRLASLTIQPNDRIQLTVGQFSNFTKLNAVVIGEGVQSIPDKLFYGCSVLKNVTLPSTVMSIGNEAFLNCSKLESLTFPENLETIGNGAFKQTGLKSVVFNEKLKTIGSDAFYRCKSLTSLTVNENIESIGQGAFFGLSDISNSSFEGPAIEEFTITSKMNIPNLGTTISPMVKTVIVDENNPYYEKNGKFIYAKTNPDVIVWSDYINGSVQVQSTPGDYAFAFKNVTSVIINGDVKTIGLCAFACNSNLTTVSLSDSVNEIGESAFSSCSTLSTISGGTIKSIGKSAFYHCSELESIKLDVVEDVAPMSFLECSNLSISALPDSLANIGNNAFAGCSKVCISKLPSNLSTLEYGAFERSGIVVETITLGETTEVNLIGGNIFKDTAIKTVVVNKVISDDPTLIEPLYGLNIVTGEDFTLWKWVCGLAISLDGSTIYRFDSGVGTEIKKIVFPDTIEKSYPLTGIIGGYKLSDVEMYDIDNNAVNFNLLETDAARIANAHLLAGKIFVGSGDGKIHEVLSEYPCVITYVDSSGKELAEETIVNVEYDSEFEAPVKAIAGYSAPKSRTIIVSEFETDNCVEYVYVINQYTITFDTTGGSDVAAITQDYNSDVVAPANPTKTGYTFAGWSAEIPAKMPVGGMTITASWDINQYTITFDTTGGSDVAAITQDYGSVVSVPVSVPSKEGYMFVKWDLEIPTTMPAVDVTIKAIWAVVATVNENGKSVVTLDASIDSFILAAETKEITVEMRENTTIKVENASNLVGKTVVSKVESISNNTGLPGVVYEFTFTADGDQYNGKMQVTLPYAKEAGKKPVVYYWSGSESTKMNVISSTETSVTFETDHNSTYVVASETPDSSGSEFMLAFGMMAVIGIAIAILIGGIYYRKQA